MKLASVETGDVVHVDKRGRRFFAIVEGPALGGEIDVRPITSGITYRTATAREVVGIYRKAKGSTTP